MKILFALLFFFTCSYTQTFQSASELDYPPYCIVVDKKADGFSVELLQEVLKAMNHDVSFYIDTWAKIKNDLEVGAIDVLPLVGRTPEREKIFEFSIPYLVTHGAIVVRSDNTDIQSFEDLNTKSVLVMQDDNTHEFLLRKKGGYSIATVKSFEEALKILASGHHDAVVVQKLVAIQLIEKLKLKNLKIVPASIQDFRQDFSFAVKEGDKELLAILNEGLSIVMANGVYNELYQKWLTPMNQYEIQREVTIKVLVFILILFALSTMMGILWHRSLSKQVALKTKQYDDSQKQLQILNDSLQTKISSAITELKEKDELMIAQSRQAAMGEMLSMIAHQWRQPLAIISMIANNLELDASLEVCIDHQKVHSTTKQINEQVSHLSSTIDDFRNFFKPNKEEQPLYVSQIIEDTLHIVGPSLDACKIEFIREIEEDTLLLIYRNEIIQVLINLINNARDALEKVPNPKIIFQASASPTHIDLCIMDNAGGIPPQIMQKLGEPYVSTKSLSGTGLGIYISKMIVEKHFKGIFSWKNLENGACFCIHIPRQ